MKHSLGTFALICLTAAAVPAHGTVLMQMDADQLADKATLVVQGKVVLQQVLQEKGEIWTDTYLKPVETIKGTATEGKLIVIRQPGGELSRMGMKVAGTARFKLNEQVLVFLRRLDQRRHVPVGMCMGKFSLRKDSRGVIWAHQHVDAGVARFDLRGKFSVQPHSAAHQSLYRLSDLLARVRACLLRRPPTTGGAR